MRVVGQEKSPSSAGAGRKLRDCCYSLGWAQLSFLEIYFLIEIVGSSLKDFTGLTL